MPRLTEEEKVALRNKYPAGAIVAIDATTIQDLLTDRAKLLDSLDDAEREIGELLEDEEDSWIEPPINIWGGE